MTTSLKVNGAMHDVPADPDTPLLYVLRNDLALNLCRCGTHNRIVRAVLRASTAMGRT